MKIAIPADVKDVNSAVGSSFGRAAYYFVFDIKDLSVEQADEILSKENDTFEYIENSAAKAQGGAGIKAAQLVVDSGADILLTPRCGENAARVVLSAGIRMYKTGQVSVKQNILDYMQNKLTRLDDIHPGLHENK